jgi:hypothetical protein
LQVRILLRDMTIGTRASMPVAHKGEWPKIVMDGFDRAQVCLNVIGCDWM